MRLSLCFAGLAFSCKLAVANGYEMARLKQAAFLYGTPVLTGRPVVADTLAKGSWVRLHYAAETERWAYVQAFEGTLGWIPSDWLSDRRLYPLPEIERDEGRTAVFYPKAPPRAVPKPTNTPPPSPWADTQLRDLLRPDPLRGATK
jgi:hypothetical protein